VYAALFCSIVKDEEAFLVFLIILPFLAPAQALWTAASLGTSPTTPNQTHEPPKDPTQVLVLSAK
jgi:hypothetical protein